MLKANEKNKYFGNKLKRMFLAACVLSCAGAMTASAQQVGLTLSSGSGSPGGRATLNVSLADPGGAQAASLQWSMKYATADITNVTVSAGAAASRAEKNVLCNSKSGITTCILSGLNFGSISPGIVATATFQISTNTQSANIPIQVENTVAASGDGSAISASGSAGTIALGTQTQAAALSGLSCSPSSVNTPGAATCTVSIGGLAPSGGFPVSVSTNNAAVTIPGDVSIGAGGASANFTVNIAKVSQNGIATLTASASGVSKTFSLNLLAAGSSPPPSSGGASQITSVFPSKATPGTVTTADGNSVELGMKFQSAIGGTVTGVRFYKGARNGGVHSGHLWSKSGSLLGTVTFTNESSSGWQQANFAKPVAIQANTTYIVSYYAPVGSYSSDNNFFSSAVNSTPLRGLQDGADGPNGVYRYGASGFPNQSWKASNYWVDVVFSSTAGGGTTTAGGSSGSATVAEASVWTPQTIPEITSASDNQSVELGMKFKSDVAGTITGVRFYKGSGNTGTHVGHLWSSNGALLASVAFTNETSSGWQQASFTKPIAIQPNTKYVVSYFAPNGHYAANIQFFGESADHGPLHALADGQSGGNGVFSYGSSGFPNQTWNATNYWVDAVFEAGGAK